LSLLKDNRLWIILFFSRARLFNSRTEGTSRSCWGFLFFVFW